MKFQPQSMTGAVAEGFPISAVPNILSRRRVHFLAADSGFDRLNRPLLCFEDDPVNLPLLL